MQKMLSEERVKAAIELALRNIHKAKCGHNEPCAPATKEEMAKPPILVSDASAAIKAGISSALLQWCGLDWTQRSFVPLMTNYRDILLMNDRQLALIGVIHGMQQGLTLGGVASKPCSTDMRRKIDARVPGRQLTR